MFLLILLAYLVIGMALLTWGVHVEPMILAVWAMFPLFILFWPYFLVKIWFNR